MHIYHVPGKTDDDYRLWRDQQQLGFNKIYVFRTVRCNIAALLVGRSRDRFPVVSLGIFSVVPPTEPCALRSTQSLKVSTRDFS